jgi:hypothetical protein
LKPGVVVHLNQWTALLCAIHVATVENHLFEIFAQLLLFVPSPIYSWRALFVWLAYLRAYGFDFQEIRAAEYPEFGT